MIESMSEWISAILLLSGCTVVLLGGIGLLRFPDFFSRMHSAGTIDTLGAWLVLAGLMVVSGSPIVAFKLLMIAALLFFLSPVMSHALARSALEDHIDPNLDPNIAPNIAAKIHNSETFKR